MAASAPPGDPGGMSEHTVEQPAVRRLERSRSDRMLAGVCGGLARYFDIHPAFYRVGFVVLTLIGGAGILIYIAAALVIPSEGEQDSIAEAVLRDRHERPLPLIALAVLAVAGLVLLSRVSLWPHGDAAWVLLLLVGGAVLLFTRRRLPAASAGAGAAPRRRRRVGRAIAAAIGALVALALVVAAVGAAVFRVHLSDGIGTRTYQPASAGDLRSSYELGIGDLRLDLRDVRFPRGETHVRGRVDIGRLQVVVPPDVALRVHGRAEAGTVKLLGRESNGRDVDHSIDQAGGRVLVLDAKVGAGSVRVSRAVR